MKVLNKLNVGDIVYVKTPPHIVRTVTKDGDAMVYLGLFGTEKTPLLKPQFLNTRTGAIIHFNTDINERISFNKKMGDQ